MAEINVQPKERSGGSFLPWLLAIIGVIILSIFLFRNKGTRDTADTTSYNNTSSNAAAAGGWSPIDWNAPSAHYDEVTNEDIDVRSGANYAVYSLDENVLFDKDAATLKPGAERKLVQIVTSINKRYPGGDVAVFGSTGASDSESHNEKLSKQKAEAVRSWLEQNGIDHHRVSIEARGETNPVASNSSEERQQQNRRVEIVARKK